MVLLLLNIMFFNRIYTISLQRKSQLNRFFLFCLVRLFIGFIFFNHRKKKRVRHVLVIGLSEYKIIYTPRLDSGLHLMVIMGFKLFFIHSVILKAER